MAPYVRTTSFYTYDALGRLTGGETSSFGFNPSSWTYDAIGNIGTRIVDGQAWDCSYDPAKVHAVAKVTINSNAHGFSSDANGNKFESLHHKYKLKEH